MDTTWKKEARTAKDDVATNSDGRAERDGGYRGVRLRPQPMTEPCGEILLWPYVPLGTKRKSKVSNIMNNNNNNNISKVYNLSSEIRTQRSNIHN